MAYTYTFHEPIPEVGVSKIRTFGGPVDLKVVQTVSGNDTAIADNFPMGLSVEDLFGAVVCVDDVNYIVLSAEAGKVGNYDVVFFRIGCGSGIQTFVYLPSVGKVFDEDVKSTDIATYLGV